MSFCFITRDAIVKGIEAASDLLVMSERPADAGICLIKSF